MTGYVPQEYDLVEIEYFKITSSNKFKYYKMG